jgi:hypothetical protein
MATVSAATREKLRALIAVIDPMADEPKKKLDKLLHSGAPALQVAKAQACLALADAADPESRRAVGFLAVPVLARHLAPGETLEPVVDGFVSLIGTTDNLRAVLARIPADRRRSIWEREFAWAREERNRSWKQWLVERIATMADVAPEVAALVEAFRRDLPKDAPAPVVRRTFAPKQPDAAYVFADPFIVNTSDWDDFSTTQRQQLLVATERMTGKKVMSARGVARALDDDADEFELRTWDVYDAGATATDPPRFDCWVFGVDNAVFFRHATVDRVHVYVLQDSFMADDDAAAAKQLAAALQASAPSSLWET